jgi:hypothetical protein
MKLVQNGIASFSIKLPLFRPAAGLNPELISLGPYQVFSDNML